MIRKATMAVMPLALAACTTVEKSPAESIASANIALANGQPAGTARIEARGGRLMLIVGLAEVSPGVHGIHLHAVGSCAAPSFASAGGHLNPAGRQHGIDNPKGRHLGDLPNVAVGSDGTGRLEITLDGTRETLRRELFDADGTAIVVHAGPDDYKTDPSGNSGGRIACGVFMPG
ncbi:MAG: superoxide dismutase family protein [Novosphingobium sp.]|nr:superoxide dismutase family protein [Novosphingobium sp.]